jgi:hypothetical protein
MQALSVGNMCPMRCHEVEGMFLIPDGRRTVRCFRGGEMTGLALGVRDFLKLSAGLQCEPHNTGDMECQVRDVLLPSPPRRPFYHHSEPLAPQAAVSQPTTG